MADRLPDDVLAEQDAAERATGGGSGLPEDVEAEQDREARLAGEPPPRTTDEQIVELPDEY